MCQPCLDFLKNRRAKLAKAGLCLCGQNPLMPGRSECFVCHSKVQMRRSALTVEGRCSCGRQSAPNKIKCQRCLDQMNARKQKRREAGLCCCGLRHPLPGGRQCQQCLDYAEFIRDSRLIMSLCRCGKNLSGKAKLCSKCHSSRNKTHALRIKSDPRFRIERKIRGCVTQGLRRAVKKAQRLEQLLGCKVGFARQHIESLFKPGMSWSNANLWHIDHHIPCAAFNLLDARQQRLCNNWRNLCPLWGRENLSKHDKLPADYITRLAELEANVL